VLDREVAVPVATVWAAWTQAELLQQWYTPRPYETIDAELDLRPGGIFRVTRRSPEGAEFSDTSCFLEVVARERLVWTTVLGAGYRPNSELVHDLQFTAVITFADDGNGGTHYRAIAKHPDPDAAARHERLGFSAGWGTAFDQLVEVMS
jgi:uncharacterized protein YndB with AHSA1/START domain